MSDNSLALSKLELGIFVIRLLLDDSLEVFEGGARVEDGGIGNGSSVVCLDLY
jgi:hypothetical protein